MALEFPGSETPVSTDQHPKAIRYLNAGVFNVSLTVKAPDKSITKTLNAYIIVYPKLISNFQASKTTIFVGESTNFMDLSVGNPVSWSWSFDGAEPSVSLEQNPEGVTYPNPGTFAVILQVVHSASNQTSITTKTSFIHVELITDLTPGIEQQMHVFPNPNDGTFTLPQRSSVETIQLFNSVGQEVEKNNIQYNRENNSVTITNCVAGMYIIRVTTNKGEFVDRILIEK